MPDPAVGAVIVRHIDELEAAIRYANRSMQAALAKATAAILDERRLALKWTGEVVADLAKPLWMAPPEWRMAGDRDDNDCYLSFGLDTTPSIDGDEPETWIGTFCGFAGAKVRFGFGTDALGAREWKNLLRSEAALLGELVHEGSLVIPGLVRSHTMSSSSAKSWRLGSRTMSSTRLSPHSTGPLIVS